MKYHVGHYKRKLIAPSLSEKPKEQKCMSLWSKVWVAHFEQFSQTCHTLRPLCQRSKWHMVCMAHGEVLLDDTSGKLIEASKLVIMRRLKAVQKK